MTRFVAPSKLLPQRRRILSANHLRQVQQNQNIAQLSASPPKGVAPLAGDSVVREPLADRRLDRPFCTNRIVYAEFGAVVHAEIKLRQIAVQVLLAHVLIRADQTALEDREIAFNAVCVDVLAGSRLAPVFLVVIDRSVLIRRPNGLVHASPVRVQFGIGMQIVVQHVMHFGPDGLLRTRDLARADLSATFHKRNEFLVLLAGATGCTLRLGRTAKFNFVGFHNLPRATERRFVRGGCHRFPDPMRHEPSRLVRYAEHSMQLVGRNAFLGRRHQVKAQNPLVQRDMALFHDRADRHRERLAASVALIHARAMRLALNERGFVHNSTVRADWAIRPVQGFKVLPRFVGVSEDWECEVGHG